MSRRFVLLLAVALALVAAAVVATRARDGAAPDGEPTDGKARPAPTEHPPTPLAAHGAGTGRPRDGAWVEGLVLRDGRPARARVEVRFGYPPRGFFAGHTAERTLTEPVGFAPRPRVPAATETDDAGRFAIDGVRPGKNEVLAVAPDGARGDVTVDVTTDGTRTTVTVVLADTTTLSGRARRADGRPFVGRVAVTPAAWSTRPLDDDAVEVGVDGGFAIAGLAPGAHDARFLGDDGVLWFRPAPSVPHAGTWEVVIDDGAATQDGRVVDDVTGEGIAGARVVALVSNGVVSVHAATQTGADGTFVVPNLVGGSPLLTVGADGYATTSIAQRPTGPVVLRLARAATLRGTVRRRRDGTSVPDAEVRGLSLGPLRVGTPFGPAYADAEGRYELRGLPPTGLAVSASAPGLSLPYAETDPSGWTPTSTTLSAGTTTSLDLVLDDAPVVRGRVRTTDGLPVPQAVVALASDGSGDAWRDAAFTDRRWVTADDGTFTIDTLPVGATVELAVATADARGARSAPFVVAADLPPVELRLAPSRAVRVLVVRADDGTPLAGAVIRDGSLRVRATGDPRGVAVLQVADGESTAFRVQRSGFAGKHVPVEPGTTEVRVALAVGKRLTGRVVTPDGRPASGAQVVARDAEGFFAQAGTSPDGAFALDDAADADHELQAFFPDRAAPKAGTAVGRPGTPIVVTVTRATDAASPAPNAPAPSQRPALTVTAVGPGGRAVSGGVVRKTIAGSHETGRLYGGTTTVAAPAGASGTVEVSNPRDEFGRPLPFAPGTAAFGPDDVRVEVRLAAGASLEGHVVDADETPIAGVVVGVVRPARARELASATGLDDALADTRTDRDGRFVLPSLPDDPDLRLVARPPGRWLVPAPRAVRAGEADLVVRLTRAVRPTITVLDPAGNPVPDAEILVEAIPRRRTFRFPAQRTDARGVRRLDALDPAATYAFRVHADHVPPWVPTYLEPWTPRDETVRLRAGLPVEVRVVDAAGRALRATVWVPATPGVRMSAQSATGVVHLPPQPPGPLRVRATAPGYVPAEVDVGVSPDLRPVTIRLERGRDLRIRLEGPGPRPSTLLVGPVGGGWDEEAEVAADGTAVLEGLDPAGRYRIWGPPAPDTDSYVLETLDGFPDETLAAPVRVGGRIRVRVTRPEGATSLGVSASAEGRWVQGTARTDGEFELRGVPPGIWTIVVFASGADGESRADTPGRPGDALDVILPPLE